MDDGSRLPWIIAVLLLFCAAFFAVAETAYASCPKSRVKAAAERGDARAKTALLILDDFDKAISTLLICTNIVHIATASIVTVAVTKMWGLSAVSISTIVTTIVVFFAGEMLPKSIAKKYSEPLALATGPVLRFLMKVFTPLSALLTWIGQSAAKLTPDETPVSFTEDELYDIIEDMTEEGSLDEQQGELISSALQFGEVTVESVLTPRVDLVAVDISSSLENILAVIKTTNHSRLPVYEGSIDNIIGVLQIRKFIKAYLRLGNNLDLRPLLDEVFFIHQSTNIDELLPVMSKRKLNMAVVTDNYGGTLGIVTVEDILEEAASRGEAPLIVICDELSDPHNLGAILRSAECAGAHGVIIPKRRSVGLTATVAKASAGAVEYMKVARVTNVSAAMQELKDKGVWIFGTAAEGSIPMYQADLTGPAAIVIGNEGEGMSQLVRKNCDVTVSIPMQGRISSLNASAAASILLYEAVRQRLG